jgi:hypothetical protein
LQLWLARAKKRGPDQAVASLVHMQTNLRKHQQEGPLVIVRGEAQARLLSSLSPPLD